MYANYRMNVNELDDRFLETLRTMFRDREIEISVSEAVESEEDETAYLLRSAANREHLLEALDDVAHGRNLVTVDPDELR
ncbi:MAG: hypothetical protein GY856_27275 [bacterium]|nr:hypothetical protein [bacterium]